MASFWGSREMNILVVAAHPDDEVLGCGATIARLAQEGHAVSILILGEGITSRYAHREDADVTSIAALHARARGVCAHLGARDVALAGLPDNRFDSVPLLEIVKIVEAHVGRVRPEVVFTQHGGDLNVDHECTYRAVLTATRPLSGCPVRQLYAFEVGSSTEWAFQQFRPVFHPNLFVDVTDTLDRKLTAMQMYEGEARSFPHPRSSEALRAQAVRWGAVAGLSAAEAFVLVREIR